MRTFSGGRRSLQRALCAAAFCLQAPGLELEGYDLALRIEPESRLVRGTARVKLHATEAALEKATFLLNDLLEVESVQRDGADAPFERGERVAEGRTVVVTLAPPLAPGIACELAFAYVGNGLDPGEQDADWMGILLVREDEIRMSHQAQWYPLVPRDEKARSKLAAPVTLALDLPAGLESLGPGTLVSVKKEKGREIHRWASKRAVHPSILAGKFHAHTNKHGPFVVRALSFPEHAAGARLWAEVAVKTLNILSELYGKVDITGYGIGEMRVRNPAKSYNYEADGFSVYDGVLFDGRTPDVRKIAHEVAHLWFGGTADASGPGERFLTEGLAEFAAWTAVVERSGDAEGLAAVQHGAERYFGSPGDEHALAATDFGSPRYVQVAYAKGAFAVRTLKAWLGAEAFGRGMEAYLAGAKSRGGAATLDDFLAAFRAQGAETVDAWAEDWLRRPGVPRYAVERSGDNAGTLVQTGALYRNPVELALKLAGGKTHVLTVLPKQLAEPWTAGVTGKIESIEIDPRQLVLFERPR